MKNLNISVVGKIAKYLQRDGAIVCGNSDYQITFTFDSEWDAYEAKIARFIWNGKYWDQPFSGNVCPVPIITNTTEVTVGVYAGDLSTTTPASIPCKRSILCGDEKIRDINVEACRDEAVAAAETVVSELAKRTQLKPEFAESEEWLEENGDKTKLYVLPEPDNHIYAFMGREVKPYINRLLTAIDENGTIYGTDYNGDGKKDGYQKGAYLSGGVIKSTEEERGATGFIPIGVGSSATGKNEQYICFANIEADPTTDISIHKYIRMAFYGDHTEDSFVAAISADSTLFKNSYSTGGGAEVIYTLDENNNINYIDVTRYTAYLLFHDNKTVKYFRLSVIGANALNDNSIITVNEEIAGESSFVYEWTDTGHAFVPTDYEPEILKLQEATAKNADDISDLNEKANLTDIEIAEIKANGTTIPEGVRNAVSALVDKAMSREGNRIFRFLISSDAHQKNDHENITKGNKELGQAQGEILNLIGVDFVANLGDVAFGHSTDTVADVVEQIKGYKRLTASALKGECQLWCEGNHDDGNYSLTNYPDTPKLTASAMNTLFYSEHKGVVYDPDHAVDGYCYKDFEHLKVRVICLNTEQGTGDGGVMEGYQLKWFAETALNMSGKTDWNVVTQAHHPFGYPMATLFKDAMNIIDAFVNKKALTNNNQSYYTTIDGTVITADYTDKNCQYVGHFHGHAHAFSVVPMEKYDNTSGSYSEIGAYEIGIPNASFDNNRNNQYLGNSNARIARYSTPTTYNKVDEDGKRTAFTLVTVCLDKKKIYADDYGVCPPEEKRTISY